MIDIEPLLQLPELPSGCEATMLTLLLNYNGWKVDKSEIAKDYVPYKIITSDKGDTLRRGYTICFRRRPAFTDYGLGCFIPCIQGAADKYLKQVGSRLKAYDLTGTPLQELLPYIAEDTPFCNHNAGSS